MYAMKYKINGEHIKEKRKEIKVDGKWASQADLIELMKEKGYKITRGSKKKDSVQKNGLSALENGVLPEKLTLHQVLGLCEVLDCSLDYILEISGYSNQKIADICEYTGLSEKSVKILNKDDYEGTKYTGNLISRYLETYNKELIDLLCQMDRYFTSQLRYEEVKKQHPDYDKKRKAKYNDIKQYEEIQQVEFFERQASADLFECMEMIKKMYAIAQYDKEVIEEAGLNY